MSGTDRELVAHLMRRAGFGATQDEIDILELRDYEDIVEDLLNPEQFPEPEEDVARRYWIALNNPDGPNYPAYWIYRMVNTLRPTEEKMALFWHHLFPTSAGKSSDPPSSNVQIETFRRNALADFETILLDLAKDPAMIYFLDNSENHNGEPNENWGRELLELFSMGVGNYTESDIKNAARAFTGWTFTQPIPLDPYARYPSEFLYLENDHDDGEKSFLGETGPFNGEDIIAIIVKQPATAKFLSRHLYNFFVADEPQVPAWDNVPPLDPDAIDILVKAYIDSKGEISAMLRVLFNSEFFKNGRFKKIKSPTELVVGTVKIAGGMKFPEPGHTGMADAAAAMGQGLQLPPTVEGWHTGKEWIDGGTLTERVNFAVNQLANTSADSTKKIVDYLSAEGGTASPNQLVEACVAATGCTNVTDETRSALIESAASEGVLSFDTETATKSSAARIASMLQSIVSSIEYQFA
ncbi:MAG: DUF1800 domain-containing protein [Acidimicrobiales bacterium]|jgi:uncharacterized protein (DUF1800 family)